MDKKTGNKKALSNRKGQEIRLNAKNRKFINLLLKDVKIYDAYKLAGYNGTRETAYQLKHKLKPFIDQSFDIEGLSREGYKVRLLKLLDFPCVDRSGKPIQGLSFNQYKEALLMLRDEVNQAESKNRTPQITAFVIKTHAEAMREQKGQQGGEVIDVQPLDVSAGPKPPANGEEA